MIAKWKDNTDVFYISTDFGNNLMKYYNKRGQEKNKPEAICEYNKFMGGIDQKDQMMAYYPCERKTLRWYKKIGIHIIYMLLMNSYFLFKKYEKPRCSLYDYRLAILENLLPEKTVPNKLEKQHVTSVPTKNPQTGAAKKHAYRRCTLCNKNKIRKETVYHCQACPGKPALCIEPCFAEFHKNM